MSCHRRRSYRRQLIERALRGPTSHTSHGPIRQSVYPSCRYTLPPESRRWHGRSSRRRRRRSLPLSSLCSPPRVFPYPYLISLSLCFVPSFSLPLSPTLGSNNPLSPERFRSLGLPFNREYLVVSVNTGRRNGERIVGRLRGGERSPSLPDPSCCATRSADSTGGDGNGEVAQVGRHLQFQFRHQEEREPGLLFLSALPLRVLRFSAGGQRKSGSRRELDDDDVDDDGDVATTMFHRWKT